MQQYFKDLEDKVKVVYSIAEQAREKGLDPVSVVEIPLATSLAERVTGLISTIYPQIRNSGIEKRIRDLEKQYGLLDPAVALTIAEEISKEKFCKFKSLLEAIDAGIRVAFAYITLGVVSSPIEGFTYLKLGKTKDGKDYFVPYFSGPIRSAGTTASCVALLIIDYLRETFGYAKYDPTEQEIKRTVLELYDYHERITNLQYLPTEEEAKFLATHLPLQISGEPSEKREVSNYKDLPRIETNFIRGGFCLILGEGLAQKAPKALKIMKKLREKGFKLTDWDFLEEYVKIHEKRQKGKAVESPTYINDLVAGRPVFGHPSRSGSFRLRYGRCRNTGYSALGIHPATMAAVADFIATGTQLKIELPTKGAAMAACDSIEGPIIKLKNGSVLKINDVKKAHELYNETAEIIYLGDILIPYGDFINRNHVLMPCGFNEEYWLAYLRKKSHEKIESISQISLNEAKELSKKHSIPLHPRYIFFWTQVSNDEFFSLLDWLSNMKIEQGKIILPYKTVEEREKFAKAKRALELLGAEHTVNENVMIDNETASSLMLNLGLSSDKDIAGQISKIMEKFSIKENVLSFINKISEFEIKDKAGTFVGARMGRPEKSKLRKLIGSPHVLFPVGEEGGRLRSVQEASIDIVEREFPIYRCDNCKLDTIYYICENCNKPTKRFFYCPQCMRFVNEDEHKTHHLQPYAKRKINIKHYLDCAMNSLSLSEAEMPALIKGVRGTSSAEHIPEHLAKGILRAKCGLHVNKDGTIRYDCTELPITQFRPCEIGTDVETLKKLGYVHDIYNKPLCSDNQLLELMPQDIILPSCPKTLDEKADDVFVKITKFIDNLLARFYGLQPFFNISSGKDLVGHLVLCMAPHNCAGVAGRIIGFSETQALLASPYMHAAMRRDCLEYNNYVPINKGGKWEIVKIGEFIESFNPSEKADNFGTLKKNVSGIYTYSNPKQEQIIELTKHKLRNILKIHLEDGRKIELTENHKVYLKNKKEKRAHELKIGDKLMVSYKKDIQHKDINELFLPEIFQERGDIMLRNIRDYLSKFEKLNKHANFYQRDSFPILFVKEFLSRHNKTLYDLPSEIKISIKRDNVSIPIRISLDESLLEVIGLYIAEGFSRKNQSKKGFYQISIAGNEEIRSTIKEVFLSHFNLKPSEYHFDHITFSSRIIYELFSSYLRIGDTAKNKRIPSMFLNLKKEKLAALLRGYFEGDGSVSLTDKRITCDTVSEGLRHDLSFVFSLFHIFTKFYEYEKTPGPKVREFYLKKNRQVPKFKITKIIIPSNFVNKFKEIGFLSKRKQNILDEIDKKPHYGMKIDFDDNYAYPRITKIEQVGDKESYCFNVRGEHNFFANDILVHNCDGDEAAVMLLLDALLNFSRKYLPAHRGGTQDAPLVLNVRIRAGEVDDMIFDVDVFKEFPLEFYEAAEQCKPASSIKMEQVKDRLDGNEEFKNLWFTHDISNINSGATCSAYKTLATMEEKVAKQMEIVERIRAVDQDDVARLVLERHFIRDIRGNLRKFSTQQFRCVKCNEKFRRPPLAGKCTKCQGKIIFTIAEGSIVKYLEPALALARKYKVSPYLRQSIELTKSNIESIFGRETEKQQELKQFLIQ